MCWCQSWCKADIIRKKLILRRVRQSILSPIYRSLTDAADFAYKKWLWPKLTESRPLANGCLVNVWFSNPDDNPSMLRHGMVSKSHISHSNKILISAFLCKLIHQHSSLKAYMIIIMLQYNSKSNFLQNAFKMQLKKPNDCAKHNTNKR